MIKKEWYREAIEIAVFHEKKVKIHGQAEFARPDETEDKGWGVRDTARELHLKKSKCAEYIVLGKALRKNGNLKYSSKTAALSLARKMKP